MAPSYRGLPLVLLLVGGLGCDGVIAVPPPAPVELPPVVVKPSDCKPGEVSPGAAPIRRMTRFEYDNTVRELLGDDTHPAADFGAEEEALGFNNNAQALSTSSALVDKQLAAAEGIAKRLTANLGRLTWFSCAPATQGARVCAEQFIDAFGARAYRRPLTPEEEADLVALYDRGAAIGGLDEGVPLTPFVAGVRLVVESVLLSPDFLYRVELAQVATASTAPSTARLDGHALAARLSYLLWATMPDDALRLAADKGELSTPEQVRAAARRMLADPRARPVVAEFHQQWLDFDRIANVGKAASVFPRWSPALAASMHAETKAFVEHVVFDGEGTYDALLTAPYTFVDARLAELYGVAAPMGNAAMTKVALDPAQRGGLLTQGSLLTLNAHSNQTSPVHRGKLVREAFLCEVLAAPPADVMITVPDPSPNTTARERFQQHSANPACSGCHKLMDPLGFGFESFDGIGVHRTREANLPIDASGFIYGTDVPGPFTGVPGLAHKLVGSTMARRCYVKQWFRFAHGRGEQPADACTIERLEQAFNEGGRDVKKLLEAITQTDAFLYARGAP